MEVTVIAIVVASFLRVARMLTTKSFASNGNGVMEMRVIDLIGYLNRISKLSTHRYNNVSSATNMLPGCTSFKSRQLISRTSVLSKSKNIHI